MSKPKLLVHIGLPKTGTTFIQKMLLEQRKLLLKHRILYPLTGLNGTGHSSIAANYVRESLRAIYDASNILIVDESERDHRDNILYEMNREPNDVECLIISAEGLAVAGEHEIRIFFECYEPYFDIEIFAFLRRQDYMAESLRSQAYRVNQLGYNPDGPFDENNMNFNYFNLLEDWSSNMSNNSLVKIINYPEENKQTLGKLVSNIFNLPDTFKTNDQIINARLSRDVVEYIYNYSDLRYGTESYFNAILRLSKYSQNNATEAKYRYFFSPEQRHQIIETHRESNAKILQKYNHDIMKDTPPINPNEEWAPYPSISEDTLKKLDLLIKDIA